MLNNVILIGRLVRDPELRYTPNGKAVVGFTMAVDRYPEGADFIDCVAWNAVAENTANYTVKGSLVAVQGRLQIRTYEAKDGNKRKVAEVICNTVKFLDHKKDNNSNTNRENNDPDGWEALGHEVSIDDETPY